jgi:DNA topoisomerase I
LTSAQIGTEPSGGTAAGAPASLPEALANGSAAPEPEQLAEAAGLVYVSDEEPGIRRRRAGRGFSYRGQEGLVLRDRHELERIYRLAIPPAWTEVWICPDPGGHIQATGRDAKGRKQYRYHARWEAVRNSHKYERILEFGRALPELRRRISQDMGRRGLSREKVLATVVHLLDTTLIRIGNASYARENRSYGLTTLRDRHVEVNGSGLRFDFKGKGGKVWRLRISDRRVARIVKSCQDLPGQHLFQYLGEDGQRHRVDSSDVNAYLREVTGQGFTAKDFRTWAGTVIAAMALGELEASDSQAAAKRNLRRAIERVAGRLGNTPTICRKCYVHPEVVNGFLEGELLEQLKCKVESELRDEIEGLRPEEAAVLAFLQRRLARDLADRRADT